MKKQLKDFPGLNLVTTVYGDDLADKSYREARRPPEVATRM